MKSPFSNMSKVQINKLKNLLEVHTYKYPKDQTILQTLRFDNIIGIILEGTIQIKNIEYNGNEITLEELSKNEIFGTNITATNTQSYEIVSLTDTEIMIIDYKKILNPKNLSHNYFNIFQSNLFDIINTKFKEKNERIKILEKKQIREKLLEYFEIQYEKTRLNYIILPFTLKDLADYLAINRSAMFRELKNLKEERFIDIQGRRINLLTK